MAYDAKLADRVHRAVADKRGVTEKKMFGGIAFLLDGKMFCGIANDDLMVRVGPERYEESLKKPHVRPMDFTGRPLKGYVYVAPAGCRTDAALRTWVTLSVSFVGTLPARAPKKRGGQPKGRR
jgi:TfoX/Sxy family transcriptional regulator of competence genes